MGDTDSDASAVTVAQGTPRVPIRERDLSDAVKDLAERLGWMVYRTWRSDHSPAGYPDLTMLRAGEVRVAELKVGKNRPTTAQREWLNAFALCGIEADVWTEEDWFDGTIERELAR